MSLCIFGDGYPAAPRADYPDRCWNHQPDPQDSYPVLVTYTHVHVVWVSADSQADAVESMRSDAYEWTDDQKTLANAGWKVEAPADHWDWETVYEGEWLSPYQGLDYKAHVEAYYRHRRELAKAGGGAS